MEQGIIFDVKEFSVHDGPGARQTVFLKGCPLRCQWCHNPEGWEKEPQLLVYPERCTRCGACTAVCRKKTCSACGECVGECPVRARRVCGERLSSEALFARLSQNADIYDGMGGGTTFSGGEPLLQGAFVLETAGMLRGHKALETCGYAEEDLFLRAMQVFDLVMMDVKLVNPERHICYTGVENALILKNLEHLCQGSTPFVVRVPLIPGVTDTAQNMRAIGQRIRGAGALCYVELLPYNKAAGAKYRWLCAQYAPDFDVDRPVAIHTDIFREFGIESRVR